MFWYHGWGMGSVMILWVVILVVIVWLITRLLSGGARDDRSSETILKQRYARGEINREQYEQQLADLRR